MAKTLRGTVSKGIPEGPWNKEYISQSRAPAIGCGWRTYKCQFTNLQIYGVCFRVVFLLLREIIAGYLSNLIVGECGLPGRDVCFGCNIRSTIVYPNSLSEKRVMFTDNATPKSAPYMDCICMDRGTTVHIVLAAEICLSWNPATVWRFSI